MQKIIGIGVVSLLTMLAYAIQSFIQIPIMIVALLLGLLCNKLYTVTAFKPGITYTGKTILRMGVALLGLRVSLDQILNLGLESVALAGTLIALTILSTVYVARVLKVSSSVGVLFGSAVGICGASAALAVSSVLPDRDKRLEENTICAVICVNLLSTVAMILYPYIAEQSHFTAVQAGVFFGMAIHDVAQVVGAGAMVSDEVLNISVVSKLIRVALLSFVVVCVALFYRKENNTLHAGSGKKSPILPFFLLMFLVLVGVNSMHLLPEFLTVMLVKLSKVLLVASIIALGLKTQWDGLKSVGYKPILLSIFATIFIAIFAYGGAKVFF